MILDDKRYVIGIDLGTTNSAVSYVEPASENGTDQQPEKPLKQRIKIFKVPQLTGSGEVNRVSVLPSFLYIPGAYDISKDSISLPWKTDENNFSGVFARDHGAKIPARLVSSAKSWLCHNNVDRHSKILPWGSGDDVYKVSPIQATASYLKHLKRAWNHEKGDDEDLYFENQMIVITVPASFDEVARDLTVEAATQAGLKNVTLLEEPLAAFYSWLIRHEHDWNKRVNENELILVCDVGGGTTDFTLITLISVDGSPRFERIAVGDHLILGGDNIDLALARHVETGFGKNKPALTGDKWKTLCHQCRQAKENILNGNTDSEKITIMGEGRGLIAGTVSSTLLRESLEKIVLDGFFPLVDSKTIKKKEAKKAITEFGLPYEQEPAMTRHLGWFLDHHKDDVEKILNKSPFPDLVLFNGGSLKPSIIQDRIRESIRHWFDQENAETPRVLENPDPDLAVALGAS
ncbi:MAG: Hsp70 family protein, partial [Desulfobacterales bacterium]|nr:Hsp70 family protein [Desulfobacterales bacterium]